MDLDSVSVHKHAKKEYTVNARISGQGAYLIFWSKREALIRRGGANSKGGAYLKGGAYFIYQCLA